MQEVVEHETEKCRGKHETKSSVFPHFLSGLPLPISALQLNRGQSRLLYLFYDTKSDNFATHSAELSNQTLFSNRVKVASAVYCSLIKHAKISQSQDLWKCLPLTLVIFFLNFFFNQTCRPMPSSVI